MDDNPTSSPSRIAQSKTIFEGVSFHIASSFHPERISELEAALLAHGARQAKGLDDEALNIVVADGPRWEGWHIIRDMELDEQSQASIETSDSRKRRKVEVVTDNWVERSIVLNRLQSYVLLYSKYSPLTLCQCPLFLSRPSTIVFYHRCMCNCVAFVRSRDSFGRYNCSGGPVAHGAH